MDAKLSPQEAAHAKSIGDTTVLLAPIPAAVIPKLLIASVIRKPPLVIAAWLKTLAWQRFRKPVQVSYSFITDFPPGDPNEQPVRALLDQFAAAHPRVTLRHVAGGRDFAESAETHTWTATAWHRVGALKNQLFQQMLTEGHDYIWHIDADVLTDPCTLQSLLDTEVPIVSAVYWTHWQRAQPGSTQIIHAGPQVWLRHPYFLDGHGYSEAEFRGALLGRRLLRVWGLGACTLFHKAAIEKGVSFAPLPEGLPAGPMSDGEDRHLCERARRLHLPLYADPWPDVYHAYHAAEYGEIQKWLGRFENPRPQTPTAQDLVSFRIDMLEPVPHPTQPGVMQHVGPQHVRGRLAQLPVLPEIAEALGSMAVGERRIVPLHYPGHYPYASLRFQRRLVALTLLDAKAFAFPPEIDRELLQGTQSMKTVDATTLTVEQLNSLLESAHAA